MCKSPNQTSQKEVHPIPLSFHPHNQTLTKSMRSSRWKRGILIWRLPIQTGTDLSKNIMRWYYSRASTVRSLLRGVWFSYLAVWFSYLAKIMSCRDENWEPLLLSPVHFLTQYPHQFFSLYPVVIKSFTNYSLFIHFHSFSSASYIYVSSILV